MARPFRFEPPAPPAGAVPRPRLLAELARRWECRLVTVVAGPGFGKTALLGAAMAQGRAARTGRDIWLSCEAADDSGDHLRRGLAESMELDGSTSIEGIFDFVWGQAPVPVSVLLDDVHTIAAGSEGALLLARLVDELPGNAHVVMASRADVPVSVGRLAAAGQLVRLQEADLVLDETELAAFATARGVEVDLLASTGGWPALAELTASAGSDLILDYLWDEVLGRLDVDRAHVLARFALVGGGGDDIASSLAGVPVRVDDLVAGLPLVQRSAAGLAALHPLWTPPLRKLLTAAEVETALQTAAAVHRLEGRPNEAIDLLAEAGAWDEVLDVIRDTAVHQSTQRPATDFGRWHRLLPQRLHREPVALLAKGLDLQAFAPTESIAALEAAAAGFRALDDVDGEVAAIQTHGLVLWRLNDVAPLLVLHQRVVELAAAGSPIARFVDAVAVAAVAHLTGDSAKVLATLASVEGTELESWQPSLGWFRSVAYRRDGDLERSLLAIEAVAGESGGGMALHLEQARLRTAWLYGDVDDVCVGLPILKERYLHAGDRFNAAGADLELAARLAWLGDPDSATALLATQDPAVLSVQSPMVLTMRLLAEAAIAVANGDERGAAELLQVDAVAMIGHPDGWYWRDRGATALIHVLVPDTRPAWETEPLGAPHRVGLGLARALEGVRDGDLTAVAALQWPDPGVVRANLPLPWVAELVAAGAAAENPAPESLLGAVGPRLRPSLHAIVAATSTSPTTKAAAKSLLLTLPALPTARVRIEVLGPLSVSRDDELVSDGELRRQRVRELLCFLVVRRRARREDITEELWPELDDRGHNLRVTLGYLQRVLQPDRPSADPPYFLRSNGPWLSLEGRDHLDVDAWMLDDLLDDADRAERSGTPAVALAAYRAALPLWRGEPHADVPYSDWAQAERVRLRTRYTSAAVRGGELLLAAGVPGDARIAARRAIDADPTAEPAYQLLARTHLAENNRAGARDAVDACRAALAALDLQPDSTTIAILSAN